MTILPSSSLAACNSLLLTVHCKLLLVAHCLLFVIVIAVIVLAVIDDGIVVAIVIRSLANEYEKSCIESRKNSSTQGALPVHRLSRKQTFSPTTHYLSLCGIVPYVPVPGMMIWL